MDIKLLCDKLLNLLFPEKCIFCGKIIKLHQGMCDQCPDTLPFLLPFDGVCPVCGKRNCMCYDGICYDGCSAVFFYEDTVKTAVRDLKFHDATYNAKVLGRLMFEKLRRQAFFDKIEYITYVPMHKKALVRRGYNQAQLLAQEIAQLSGKPLVTDLLLKVRQTKPQHEQNRQQRRYNLQGAIRINLAALDKIDGMPNAVLLCDDVLTTCSTANACSQALKAVGIEQVYLSVVATVKGGKNQSCQTSISESI